MKSITQFLKFIIPGLLAVAGDAAFIVGTSMAAIAAGRIEFALDLVQGHEVSTMRHVTVRPVAILDGRFHLDLIGVTVVAEGTLVTG